MHQPDLLAVRLPAMVTDPELKEKFKEVAQQGFDVELLWSSVSSRLGMSAGDELWLHHMDEILEGLEDDVNDSDLLPEHRTKCVAQINEWDNFFSDCQQIYAHTCSNYSMLQNHPILDTCFHHFEVNEHTGIVILYKEKDRDEDDELKKAIHPTHQYPYRRNSSPHNWN